MFMNSSRECFALAVCPFPRYRYGMLHGCAILLATAAAGLIAGADAHTFVAATVAAALSSWLPHVARISAQDLYVNLDPTNPDGALLLGAFREALAFARHTRQPVRLRIAAFTRNARPVFRINLNRDADLELACNARRKALKQPRVWLPDHPLPLTLPHNSSITLLLEPRGAERVRASLACAASRTPGHWSLPLLLAAAACLLDIDWLLAAALGFAFQAYLSEHQPKRANHNPEIQRS
jgi:hypothetical protein